MQCDPIHNLRLSLRATLRSIALCAALAVGGQSHAAKVIVVLSDTTAPYVAAAESAEKELRSKGHKITRASVTDAIAESQAASEAIVLAIGPAAAMKLESELDRSRPYVFCMVADPSALRLGSTRAAAGVTTDVPESDQFKLIRSALPRASKLACLFRAKSPKSVRAVDRARKALPSGMTLDAIDLDGYASVAEAIDAMFAKSPDIVWTTADPSVYDATTVRALLLESLRVGVPVYGFSPQFVKAGALLGVGINPSKQGQQAAQIIAEGRFTSSGAPGLKVEATSYETAVNTIVAERLSIALPSAFVKQADQVFADE